MMDYEAIRGKYRGGAPNITAHVNIKMLTALLESIREEEEGIANNLK